MALHDMLFRDWGTDLPIRGGYGQSQQDPIIITATDPETVALTQMLTIQGLGRGRRVFWRSLDRVLLGNEWPQIEQFKIETVELTKTEIITQTENYYFDVSAMNDLHRKWSASPVVSHRDTSGLVFPFEIGWAHFDGSVNNESEVPGLGFSFQYKAPSIDFTVYVYDLGRTDISDDATDQVVRYEFEAADRDIVKVNPELVAWPDQPAYTDHMMRYYKIGNDARDASLLALTVSHGKFIKVRATWSRDPFIDRVANNFIESLLALIRHKRSSDTKDMTDQAPSDLAAVLAAEFEQWFRNLGLQGALPRAFTGVTNDGNQAIVILTGLPLNHVQRRGFLIWLCRTEQFVAYAYATRVGVAADSDAAITECLDIYASSDRYDASKTLGIDKLSDGTYKFIDQHQVVLPASPKNGLFFGLQRSTNNISSDDQELFVRLWRDAKPKAMWRQR
jgi:hypothetical protein